MYFGNLTVSFMRTRSCLPTALCESPPRIHLSQHWIISSIVCSSRKCGQVLKTSFHTENTTFVFAAVSLCFLRGIHVIDLLCWIIDAHTLFGMLEGSCFLSSDTLNSSVKNQWESWPPHELNIVPSKPRGKVFLSAAVEDQLIQSRVSEL